YNITVTVVVSRKGYCWCDWGCGGISRISAEGGCGCWGWGFRPYFENYIVDASILDSTHSCVGSQRFLGHHLLGGVRLIIGQFRSTFWGVATNSIETHVISSF